VTGRIPRTGPAVRAALAELAPPDCARLEIELRAALRGAEHDLDLAGPDAVLQRWWAVASVAANPLSADEQAALERARTGDVRGLYYRTVNSVWERC
jgi:hypothetical protein